jgi:hypothetical protein
VKTLNKLSLIKKHKQYFHSENLEQTFPNKKHKQSFRTENLEQTFPNKKHKQSFHSDNLEQTFPNKSINILSILKTIIELSIINSIPPRLL